jgi:hypothetical protein
MRKARLRRFLATIAYSERAINSSMISFAPALRRAGAAPRC